MVGLLIATTGIPASAQPSSTDHLQGICETTFAHGMPAETNVVQLYGVLNSAGLKKSEYEADAAYRQRIAQALENVLPKAGVDPQDGLIFTLHEAAWVYDPEKQEFSLKRDYSFQQTVLDGLKGTSSGAVVTSPVCPGPCSMEVLTTKGGRPTLSTYVGQNALGAKTKVIRSQRLEFGINPAADGSAVGLVTGQTFGVHAPSRLAFTAAPAEAALMRPNLRVMLCSRLVQPFVAVATGGTVPTIGTPLDIEVTTNVVTTQTLAVAVVDVANKRVLLVERTPTYAAQ